MSRGEQLSARLLARLEERFRGPLGALRIHVDDAAGRAARERSARAFTVGSHIYFGRGEFRPDTLDGFKLLVHEAAHVDQFRRGLVDLGAQSRLERFADDHARRIAGIDHVASPVDSITSFSIELAEGTGPAARAALERIGHRAVELARAKLARMEVCVELESLVVQSRVDIERDEEAEAERLARIVVRRARACARVRVSPQPLEGRIALNEDVETVPEASPSTRLADLLQGELDSSVRIDNAKLLRLATGEKDGSDAFNDADIDRALLALKRRTLKDGAFDKSYLDFLLERIADESPEAYRRLLSRIGRMEDVREILALEQKTDYFDRAQKALDANDRAGFIAEFENACYQVILRLIGHVEQQAIEGLIHYTSLGVERGEMTAAEATELMGRLRHTAGMTAAAPTLSHFERDKARHDRLAGMVGMRDPGEPLFYPSDDIRKRFEEVREELKLANTPGNMEASAQHLAQIEEQYRTIVRQHPVLLLEGVTSDDLKRILRMQDREIAALLQPKLENVLQRCRQARKYVYERNVDVWSMPNIVGIAKAGLGIDEGTQAARWIEEEQRSRSRQGTIVAVVKAIISIALGIGALVSAPFTGGGSLAAWAVFLGCTVGGIGMGVWAARHSTEAFERRRALAQSTMDRWDTVVSSEGLDAEEKLLWIEWVGVVGFAVLDAIGVGQALKISRAVKQFSTGARTIEQAARDLRVSEQALRSAVLAQAERRLAKGELLPASFARVRLEQYEKFRSAARSLAEAEARRLGSAPAELLAKLDETSLKSVRGWDSDRLKDLSTLFASSDPGVARMAQRLATAGEMEGIQTLARKAANQVADPKQVWRLEVTLERAQAARRAGDTAVAVEVPYFGGRRLTQEEFEALNRAGQEARRRGGKAAEYTEIDVETATTRESEKTINTEVQKAPTPERAAAEKKAAENAARDPRAAAAAARRSTSDTMDIKDCITGSQVWKDYEKAGLRRGVDGKRNIGVVEFGTRLDDMALKDIEAAGVAYVRTNKQCREYLDTLIIRTKAFGDIIIDVQTRARVR